MVAYPVQHEDGTYLLYRMGIPLTRRKDCSLRDPVHFDGGIHGFPEEVQKKGRTTIEHNVGLSAGGTAHEYGCYHDICTHSSM